MSSIIFLNLIGLALNLGGLSGNTQVNVSELARVRLQNGIAALASIEYNHSAPEDEVQVATGLQSLGVTVQALQDTVQKNQDLNRSLNHCKSLVYRTLEALPPTSVAGLKQVTLHFSEDGRRGYGGGSTIVLRCLTHSSRNSGVALAGADLTADAQVRDEEFVGVFGHEIGHVVDTGVYNGTPEAGASAFHDGPNPIYNNDVSVKFYSLSFVDENTRKAKSSELDFVSGYAMNDPFEDFAETFNFYLLHGKEFKKMKASSKILQRKYNFMKMWIFDGKEFETGGNSANMNIYQRYFDTTVLPSQLEKFFVI